MRLDPENEKYVREMASRHNTLMIPELLGEIDALRAELKQHQARNTMLVDLTLKIYHAAKEGQPKDYINPFGQRTPE